MNIDINIHLTRPEDAAGISARDFTRTMSPFVSLNLGDTTNVFLRDLTVIDALESALAQARTLLTAVQA